MIFGFLKEFVNFPYQKRATVKRIFSNVCYGISEIFDMLLNTNVFKATTECSKSAN